MTNSNMQDLRMFDNPQTAHKNAQKRSDNFKPCIHIVSTGMNFAKIWLSMCANGSVRFARYCGKMFSRHLFPYGGLGNVLFSLEGGEVAKNKKNSHGQNMTVHGVLGTFCWFK